MFSLTVTFLKGRLALGDLPQDLAKNLNAAIVFLETNGKAVIVRNLSKLKSLGTFVAESVAPFRTKSFWKAGDNGVTKLWFSDEFQSKILDNAPAEVSYPGERLERLSLTESMWDSMIQNEAGDRSAMSIGEYLAWMKGMIFLQPKGKKGLLLVNGYSNIRYVAAKDGRQLAVYASWHDGKWEFHCDELSRYGQSSAGYLAFFPATAEAENIVT